VTSRAPARRRPRLARTGEPSSTTAAGCSSTRFANGALRRASATACRPYLIRTNRQIAEIAGQPARTKADLHAIHGLGQTKIDRWGEEILTVVAAVVDVGDADQEPSSDG
jgi:superfamily II DNA helicase RecQ